MRLPNTKLAYQARGSADDFAMMSVYDKRHRIYACNCNVTGYCIRHIQQMSIYTPYRYLQAENSGAVRT